MFDSADETHFSDATETFTAGLAPGQQIIADNLCRREAAAALALEITEMAGHINAISYRCIKLLSDFDEARGWQGDGIESFPLWLNWQCGIGSVAA